MHRRKLFSFAFALIVALCEIGCRPKAPRFVLIGDSTMSDYPPSLLPLTGWGQALRHSLQGRAEVINKAVPGSSTLSFSRGYWKGTVAYLESGDYVLIQFGHNDGRQASADHTEPWGNYRKLLAGFVMSSRKVGAVPVLITPIPRYEFFDGRVLDAHPQYADSMRSLASELEVPLVDLGRLAAREMEKQGELAARMWFMVDVDGKDIVHLTNVGASNMASIVEYELVRLGFL